MTSRTTAPRSPARGDRGARAAWLRRLTRVSLLLVLGALLGGCASIPQAVDLPPPIEATTLGVGDVFEIRIVGEEKLPTSYTIAPDGSVDLPYVGRLRLSGLQPQEIAQMVRQLLIEKEILKDPSVSVSLKEYHSRHIEVLGEVARPGSLPMQPGMTLLRAISMSGGFSNIANKSRVTIRRKVAGGKTQAATVSVDAIIDNKIPDPPLQAGDSINVEQRVF